MNDVLNLLTQLGAFHSKRKDKNSKIRFLSTIQKYLKDFDVESDIYKYNDQKKSLMLVVGDLEASDEIYMTHFDTPKWIPSEVYIPGDLKKLKAENFTSVFISILALLIISLPFIYFASTVWTDGIWDYRDFILIIYMVLLIIYIKRNRSGFYRKDTLVRNTSSVIALIKLAKRNPEKTIVFVDYGCEDLLGYYLFKNQFPDKKIIYLDSIGYGGVEQKVMSDGSFLLAPPTINYKNPNIDLQKNIVSFVYLLEENL